MKGSPFKSGIFRVTSPFGNRPSMGDYHWGIDLVDDAGGGAITAVEGGLVTQSRIVTDHGNLTWQWGNYVCVQSDDGIQHYYCHMASRAVRQGQSVKRGDLLGIMGNTGYSFGAHLHFEVRFGSKKLNPADYLGFPNAVGTVDMRPKEPEPEPDLMDIHDMFVEICDKCGYEQKTREKFWNDWTDYPWCADFWRKMHNQMFSR